MAGFVGVAPDGLTALAGLLDDAALELRGCASAAVEAGAESGERLRLVAVAEWAEEAARDMRRRASVERAIGVAAPPFGGSQHGKGNKRIDPEQRARLQALVDDPATSRKDANAAQEKIDADMKARGEKRNRQWKDAKNRRAIDPKELQKPAEYAAAGATTGMALWWLGKLASPLCGPAVVVCAVAA